MYADDTIAAIATPQGPGGVGIVRASGPLCSRIAAAVFARQGGARPWIPRYLYHGRILDAAGGVLDDALAVLMRAPHSYTGEDVLELHCHGSPVLLGRVLTRVLSCGARPAEPGEFTRRAFLNGRLDLTQAEAVLDMVRARTGAGAALAMAQLCGGLTAHLARLRSQLLRLKAWLEAQIDFPDEDLPVEPGELMSILTHCIDSVNDLIHTYSHGKIIRDGVQVAIVGKPNVGKSSLLNALLGEDRAIVTAIPGTTRDSIDETLDLDGVPVVLSDTAGLRAADDADAVERIGMQHTAAKLAAAQALLVVVDASQPLDTQDHAVLQQPARVRRVVVLNKIDLPRCITPADVARVVPGLPSVAISATQRLGLCELRRALLAAVLGTPRSDGGPVLTNVRHVGALTKVRTSLGLAQQSLRDHQPADLVAVDVQEAIDQVGEITGAITSEDVLDEIFSEFCIGK